MIKSQVTFLLVLTAVSLMHAQSLDDLAAKYKKVTVYQVRPGVLMTARFAGDGRVCEMVLRKDHYPSENKADLTYTISKKDRDELIDELVPVVDRGAPIKGGASGFISGNVSQTKLSYENVSIDEVGGFVGACVPGTALIVVRWRNRGCTFANPTELSRHPTASPTPAR